MVKKIRKNFELACDIILLKKVVEKKREKYIMEICIVIFSIYIFK